MEIPKEMLSARLVGNVASGIREFNQEELEKCIKLETVQIPPLKSGQVLIKVERTVINPADMSSLKGTYGNKNEKDSAYKPKSKEEEPEKTEGAPLGVEGSGTVVAYGGGWMAWKVMGKRVGFVATGAWSEYVVIDSTRCIDIGEVPWEAGVSCFVNPLTVISFLEIAQARQATSLIHTAAASALGKMLIKNGKRKGIEVICVVRSEEQEKACKEAGAQYVFNSKTEGWVKELRTVCEKLKTKLAFDAVSGPMVGDLLFALCDGGEVQVYGGLSEQPASNVSTRDLIFKNKKVGGFWLTQYMKTKNMWGLLNWTWEVAAQLQGDFKTDISQVFSLKDIHKAILNYSKDMNSGKTLINCNLNENKN